ncbi:glycoside hydrolase family 19 protein [Labedaea rhizosphaerae]|uniref:Putative chitinase n=1 Tax=Labedaea rhizosphaerae TaxID=598644 RepID=A0A4R6SJA9_LABRH|nr:glycoside hydrolase family 19 protein [Labedaea rhizosphaerae]TDQ04138.1 putative chitinase [Labedaea rhizosphaerae]
MATPAEIVNGYMGIVDKTYAGLTAVPAAVPGPATSVTVEQLMAIMPKLSRAQADAYLPLLNQAMADAQVNNPKRKATFLSQLAEESADLTDFEENASGRAYEGNRNLGNTQPGDGPRFKGRGPIQLTGRDNYTRAGRALGVDLVNHPELVQTDPAIGFRTAAWFWNDKHPNAAADAGDFTTVTKKVNGGTNGIEIRRAAYNRALKVLGG